MQSLIILWVVFLLSSGFVKEIVNKNRINIDNEVAKQEDVQPSPEEEVTSPKPSPQKSVKGANIEVKVVTPTNSVVLPNDLISYFKYPNAKSLSSSENKLALESGDDSKVITDWYKERINSKGMNVKSFVSTSANDNIENKLVAANSDFKVSVTIKGVKGGSFTITVETSKD